MSFRDGSFAQRFNGLGDLAESVFESVYDQGFVRFGLQRPPISLSRVPGFIRFSPDYLTARGLVEVQGFGTDQTAKFKLNKLRALAQWDAEFRVDFFLYDSKNEEYAWMRLTDFELWIGSNNPEVDSFNEGNKYYPVRKGDLPVCTDWINSETPMAGWHHA